MKIFKRKSAKTVQSSNSLKSKFGAFAMSNQDARNISGGTRKTPVTDMCAPEDPQAKDRGTDDIPGSGCY